MTLACFATSCNNAGIMPRFALLHHHCPPHFGKPSHWDFMLESDGALRTWELQELPSAWATQLGETSSAESGGAATVTARQLPDHRLAYLDYEGPLTGDRGRVRCCQRGTYQLLQQGEKNLIVVLAGALLRGKVQLERQCQAWILVPCADETID